MEERRENKLPSEPGAHKWLAVGLTVIISGLLTLWAIYVINQYGLALFVFIPLFIGASSTIIFGRKREVTKRDALQTGLLTLLIYTLGLFLCAMEGLICIAMAAPIAIPLTLIGSILGYAIVSKVPNKAPLMLLFLFGIIPTMSFVEKDHKPVLTSVTTSIEIDAVPQTVWKNVIEFPLLDEPTEFIFKVGIAYPVDAVIKGTGVGSVRHCNFTTGSFVEPITIWDEPKLLGFDVVEQPAPMKELSIWDIDAPHLNNYFASKRGQFRLIELPNGNTLLEGTTWYSHNISPSIYWQLWSDYIIHTIHKRVLTHIKTNSERE